VIIVREITGEGELEVCRDLRRKVFIEEQKVPEAEEWDGLDGEARHLLAFAGANVAGTARVRRLGQIGKIERVCVLAEARGTGLGRALMQTALELLRAEPSLTHAKLGAQTHAIAFYETLGFVAFGPEYDDAGIPHRDMKLKL
jgi:ElaA protein